MLAPKLEGDPVPLTSNNQVFANLCAFYIRFVLVLVVTVRTPDNHVHQFKWDLPKLEWVYFNITAHVKNFNSTLEGKVWRY